MKIPKNRKQELALIQEIDNELKDVKDISNLEECIERLSYANPGKAYRYSFLLGDKEVFNRLSDLKIKVEELHNSQAYIPFKSLRELIKAYKSMNAKHTTKFLHDVLNKGMASLFSINRESYTLPRLEKLIKILIKQVYMGNCDASVLHSSATQIAMWEAAYIGLRDGNMDNIYPYDILETNANNFQVFYLELVRAFQMFDVVMEGVLNHKYLTEEGYFIEQPYEIDIPRLITYSEEVYEFLVNKRNKVEELLNEWELKKEVINDSEYQEALFVAKEISLDKLNNHITSLRSALDLYKGNE